MNNPFYIPMAPAALSGGFLPDDSTAAKKPHDAADV